MGFSYLREAHYYFDLIYFTFVIYPVFYIMTLLLIFGFSAVFFSFLCSIWEAVLLSMPDSFVEIKASEGDPIAPLLKTLKSEIDKPLSAILSLNTIAHTVGAIMVGKQAETVFGNNGLNVFGYELPFTFIVATLMTLAVLFLSEIIPKTIGANNWKQLSTFTAKSLKIIIFLMTPLVAISQILTSKLKGSGHSKKISREELSAMATMGSREGLFNSGESQIITNLMRFHILKTHSIMTPRTVVVAADENLTIVDFYDKNPSLSVSRIPIYSDKIDHITGYVLKDVILECLIKNKGKQKLKDIARKITVVTEDQDIQSVFNLLLSTREHIALVSDKYGGMAGIVTIEDVIETLLGLEIVDELDDTVDMQALARKKWEERAKEAGLLKQS